MLLSGSLDKDAALSGSLIAGAFVNYNWGLSFTVPGMIIGGVGFLIFLLLVPCPEVDGSPFFFMILPLVKPLVPEELVVDVNSLESCLAGCWSYHRSFYAHSQSAPPTRRSKFIAG